MNNQAKQTQAFIILISCVLFNLTIGVLYAWSVFKTKLTTVCEEGGYGWSAGQAGLPYSICIIVFAVSMLMGGRLQDKNGPRRVATVAGILTGMGLIICGLAGHSILGITLGFGVVTGCGMGIGYGCVNPPVLKWFPPDKKGLVSGLVVGGYGLAAV
ncbi:MAG: MFS transporter, partial [Clostridiales bacterium]|nr:MFS transporter [Clostridiales bacterium]